MELCYAMEMKDSAERFEFKYSAVQCALFKATSSIHQSSRVPQLLRQLRDALLENAEHPSE